jgi:hypothetical protein
MCAYNKLIAQSIIQDVINTVEQHLKSNYPIRILIHGPRKSGKTSALGFLCDLFKDKSIFTQNEEPEDREDCLIFFDNLDRDSEKISELNRYKKASVIATARGRYQPVGSPWQGWTPVSIGQFSRDKIEVLTKSFQTISTEKARRQEIIDGVWHLSNGHPFLAWIALKLLEDHWNEFKARDKLNGQDFENFCQEYGKEVLIDQNIRYLQNFSREAKMMLTMIAITSNYVVDPYDQSPVSSPVAKSSWLHRLRSGIDRIRSRPTHMSESSAPPPPFPITTDALMVTRYAQKWALSQVFMINFLEGLDELRDEGVVTYDASRGWQITPLVSSFFRVRGWAAIKDIDQEMESYF